jgi:XTP/dITP diphosphohydrolase
LLKHAEDPQPIIAEGVWHGEILVAPLGEHGFGYDPIFWDPIHQMSAAQLPTELKNRISHRGQALQQLKQKLQAHA